MFKNISITFLSRIITALLNLVTVVILSRYLGASVKGEASLIISTITLYLIGCNIIGGATLVYMTPRHQTGKLMLISYAWSFSCCMLLFFVFNFFHLVSAEMSLPVALLACINSLGSININILLGKQKIKAVNMLLLLQVLLILSSLFVAIKIVHNNNINGYIYALYIAYGAVAISSLLLLFNANTNSKNYSSFKTIIIESFKYGALNQLGHIIQFTSLRLSYYLLNNTTGSKDLGIYSNAISLTESIWLISNSIATVQYSKIANSTNREESILLTQQLSKVSSMLCLLAVIVLVIIPEAFYLYLFGEEFIGIKNIIYLLAPGIFVYNYALIIGHYFSGIGKYQAEVMANFGGLIITLVLSFVAIKNGYNSLWASGISSISYITTAIILTIMFIRISKTKLVALLPTTSDNMLFFSQLK